jgi:hypothetical protein
MLTTIDRILRGLADATHREAAFSEVAMWASVFFSMIGYERQEEQE